MSNDELFKYAGALARIQAESCRSIGLLPESSYTGRYPDPSFDMPSVEEHSCPSCDEELHMEFGQCVTDCRCPCHEGE